MATYNFSHQIYHLLKVKADSKEEAVEKLLNSDDWEQYEKGFQAVVYDNEGREIYDSGVRK